jgi:predicted metal-dependent hydrolase|uniref:WLM domain-containing protein n=1 Tax=viral metagenome TaxID=1070528 RepID=A0A6C0EDV8_9ZZZZ
MIDIILITILIIFIYIFLKLNNNNKIIIKSDYGIITMNKDNDKQSKSLLLEKIVDNMYILKNYLKKNINNYKDYEQYIELLDKNFNKNRTYIYETDPTSNFTSYSVNKGEELSICLKSKKNNQLHDINLLMYVIIHEMAHFACPEIGHGPLFQKIFKKLVETSISIGIYNYENYLENPVEYCGMTLNSTII